MMYFNDHDPPHVHVEFAEYRARINIWVRTHQKELAEAWLDVGADRKPTRIA